MEDRPRRPPKLLSSAVPIFGGHVLPAAPRELRDQRPQTEEDAATQLIDLQLNLTMVLVSGEHKHVLWAPQSYPDVVT